MKYLKLFESYENITQIILNLIKEYDETPYNINNGLCDSFAGDVIEKLGGYTDNLFELTEDMFFNVISPEDTKEYWDDIIETKYGIWSKKMLDIYGYPPVDLEKVDDQSHHTWIFYNGKHYDAETPNGVEKWYDITMNKKFFDYYK